MRRPLLFRLLRAAVATAVVLPAVSASPAMAAPARTVDRTALAAYVVGQLSDADSYLPFGPGIPDTGLSIDGALALSAAGGHDATVARVRSFVAGQVGPFADPTDAKHAFSGGGVAKIALLAEVTGADPRFFGGFDLITALAGHVCTAGQVAADRTNCPAVGIYRGVTSTFGQSLGVLAQSRSGGAPAAAVAALVSTRCPDGSFRSILPATSSCPAGGGDVDSTSMAAQALAAAGGHEVEVDAAIAWVAAAQLSDGGFPGTAGDNTNSAGLAMQAMTLHAGTYSARLSRAQSFLGARQNGDGGLGINTTSDGAASDVRASTQGLNGTVGTPFSTLSRAVAIGTAGAAQSAAAGRGATYLTSSAVLSGGTHVESGGYVDYGLSADIAIALAAAGGPDGRLKAIVTYLRAHVAGYADPAGVTPGFPGPYSGALAKLALLAEITGQDPHAFGGYDLLGLLRSHQCNRANAAKTCTAAGDFFQAFSGTSQAIGVLALARAGSVKATDPGVVRLRQLQCPDGGFSSTLPPASPCVSDVDTTGFALQALALVSDDATATTSPAADALVRGQDYVLSVRRSDGSFPGAAGNNTNSTALAVQALLASPGTHRVTPSSAAGSATAAATASSPGGAAIHAALSFLTGEQNGDGGFGINADAAASDARASAQVVPALALTALDTLRHRVTLAGFVAPTPTSVAPSRTSTASASATAPGSASAPASVPRSGSPVVLASGAAAATLANTGVDRRALDMELLAALALLAGGTSLIALGRQRRPRGGHR
jgi:prenyltransferase beta subunit